MTVVNIPSKKISDFRLFKKNEKYRNPIIYTFPTLDSMGLQSGKNPRILDKKIYRKGSRSIVLLVTDLRNLGLSLVEKPVNNKTSQLFW